MVFQIVNCFLKTLVCWQVVLLTPCHIFKQNQNFQNINSLKYLAEDIANEGIATFRYDKREITLLKKGKFSFIGNHQDVCLSTNFSFLSHVDCQANEQSTTFSF